MLRHLAPIAVLIAGLGLLIWIDQPSIRYLAVSNQRACSAAQLLNIPSNVDVVVLGSSRIRRGISTEVMVEVSNGEFASVYNLGRPSPEIIRSYVIVRDLAMLGKLPKVVVLEVDVDNIRGAINRKWAWDGKNAVWTTYSDLVRHGIKAGQISETARAFATKISQGIILNLSGAPVKTISTFGGKAPTVCFLPGFDTPNKKRERKKKRKEGLVKRKPDGSIVDWIDEFDFAENKYNLVELEYLNMIRNIARAEGSSFFVIRPFSYLDPPMSDRVVAEIQQLIPEFQTPPAEFVRTNTENFMDATHFNPEGRRNFSTWLVEQILAENSI